MDGQPTDASSSSFRSSASASTEPVRLRCVLARTLNGYIDVPMDTYLLSRSRDLQLS